MTMPSIQFDNVTRRFGSRVALDGLSLTVEPGTVLGLIGRNGAGKTTALKLTQGILWPDSGRIRVLGLDPAADGLRLRSRVSLLSEEHSLYPWMTVAEILSFASRIHPRWDGSLAESFRGRLDLEPDARVRSLSRGSRAKLALVLAVACRPDLLLLDDPTSGLDPLVRQEVLEGILEAVPEQGGAVVYASHLVQDVERVADRIAVLDSGRLRIAGALEDIKERIRRATAVFDDPAPTDAAVPGRIDARADGRVLTVVAEDERGRLAAELNRLGAVNVQVEALSLEEILVALLRQGPGAEVSHV